MARQAKTLSNLCRLCHQTVWKRWIIYSFSSRGLFELRMMKIFKVSKTDIAGKTLLQWLVEYDADVHIKILLDAGYSIFHILTKHKTKVPLSAFGLKLNIDNLHSATHHIYCIRCETGLPKLSQGRCNSHWAKANAATNRVGNKYKQTKVLGCFPAPQRGNISLNIKGHA